MRHYTCLSLLSLLMTHENGMTFQKKLKMHLHPHLVGCYVNYRENKKM